MTKEKCINIAVFLLPLAAILFIFRSTLFANNFFYNGDSLYSFFPYFDYKLRGGSVIAQQILSGFPVFVSVTGVWFYPINKLATFFFSPLRAYVFLDIANILVAYIVTYWYCRKIAFNHVVSVFVAFIFISSGQLLLWSETLTNTNYYFLLPAAFLSLEYLFYSKRKLTRFISTVALSLSLGAGWLSGHVQYVVYIHIIAVLYFIFLLYVHRSTISLLKKSLSCVTALVASFVIGMPQILAILAYKTVSARSGGVKVSDFFEGSYLPQDSIHYLLPFYNISGISFSNPNLYIGIIPFVLLILAFIYYKDIKKPRFYFFLGLFICCLVSSIRYSPLGFILHYMPLLNSFREAPRIMFLGQFGAAVAIGYVFNLLINEQRINVREVALVVKRILIYGLIPLSVLFSFLHVFFEQRLQHLLESYFFSLMYQETAQLPHEHYSAVIGKTLHEALRQFSLADMQMWILLISFVGAYVFFSRVYIWKKRNVLVVACTMVVITTSLAYMHRFSTISVAQINQEPQTATLIKAIQTGNKEPYRVFSIFPGLTLYNEIGVRCASSSPEESFALQKEMLLPNINIYYGIDVIDGYDNFMARNVSEVLASVGSEQSVTGDLLANLPLPLEERIELIREKKETLQKMNVKYVLSHYEINDSDFTKIFEEYVGNCKTKLNLYALKNAWPRYFFTEQPVHSIYASRDVHDALPRMGYNSMTFTSTFAASTTLFVGNTFLPDWQATLDGVPVEIKSVDPFYMAISVPAGDHTIIFTYKLPPNPFRL